MSILVTDDDEAVLTLIKLFLARAGHTVTCALTSGEAFKLIEKQHFDLLITDIFMPAGGGIELIKRLRQADSTLKILVVSGGGLNFDTGDCLQTARNLGVHAALAKPFTQASLFAAVDRALSAPVRCVA